VLAVLATEDLVPDAAWVFRFDDGNLLDCATLAFGTEGLVVWLKSVNNAQLLLGVRMLNMILSDLFSRRHRELT